MNAILRNSILSGLFVIPFIVFFVSSSTLFPFIAGKNFAFRVIVEIVFVLWAILALRDAEYLPRKSWILYTYTAFFVTLAIADIFGANPVRSFWSNYERMEGLIGHIHLFLYFIVLSSVVTRKKLWNSFFATWVGSSVIMSIYGLFQLAGKAVINQGGARVDGTFGNAIYLAVFLMFAFFFTCHFIARSIDANRNRLWFLIPIGLLQLYVLYFTATRGVILGLLGGILLTALFVAIRGREQKTLRNLAFGILGGVVILVIGFVAVRNTSYVQTSPVLSRFASLSVSGLETQGRYYIWPMAFKGFLERPILGWGQENFSIIFSKYYNPKMYNQEQWFDRAHSGPIDWLVAGGALTFFFYIAMFIALFWYLWKQKGSQLSILEQGLMLGLAGAYFFQGIFVFDNLFSSILFFTMLAYVHAETEGEKIKLPTWLNTKTVRSGVTAVLAVVLVFTLYAWNWKPIRAGQTLIDAMVSLQQGKTALSLDQFDQVFAYNTFGSGEAREQLVNNAQAFLGQSVPEDLKLRYVTLAQKQAEIQVKENPEDARSEVFYATLLGSIGANDQSLAEYKKAEALSPNKQSILFQLGGAYIAVKDYANALATFKKAYELETSNKQAQIIYGVGEIYAGDLDSANKIFTGIDENTLIFDDRIIAALGATNRFTEIAAILEKRLATPAGQGVAQNYISLGISYIKLGQRAKAVSVLNVLVTKFPEYKEQVDAYLKQA